MTEQIRASRLLFVNKAPSLSLSQAEDLIHKYNKKEQSVVAMIVEPVQGEGGGLCEGGWERGE